jgi:hypothetical protein
VDVTPLYKIFQKIFKGDDDGRRRYFSLIGHFKDPMRWVLDPMRSAIHKGSPVTRMVAEAWQGQDWRGAGFTGIDELLGVDEAGYYKTSGPGHSKGDPKGGQLKGKFTDRSKKPTPIGFAEIPSYILTQMKGSTPVQVQEVISVLEGQRAWFDALSRSMGMHLAPGRNSGFDVIVKDLGEFEDRLAGLRLTDRKAYASERKANPKVVRAASALNGYERRIRTYKKKILSLEKNKTFTDEKKKEMKSKYEDEIRKIQQQFIDRFGDVI